jgi:hypothetical protein
MQVKELNEFRRGERAQVGSIHEKYQRLRLGRGADAGVVDAVTHKLVRTRHLSVIGKGRVQGTLEKSGLTCWPFRKSARRRTTPLFPCPRILQPALFGILSAHYIGERTRSVAERISDKEF